MFFDRARTRFQRRSDLSIRLTQRQTRQHSAFASGQVRQNAQSTGNRNPLDWFAIGAFLAGQVAPGSRAWAWAGVHSFLTWPVSIPTLCVILRTRTLLKPFLEWQPEPPLTDFPPLRYSGCAQRASRRSSAAPPIQYQSPRSFYLSLSNTVLP
jgi:hypothetical protein